ncbi:MAG: DUF2380 domain-containing protein, partial [Candidatus Marinimicrobia bacterium]|nr:DUF2380 domain-containing protein [Candidatus Neomarinimicrobiota bacterium]
VIDFEAKGVSEMEASALTDRLRDELFKTGQYKVMERAMMEEILNEQGFQISGCTSDECVIEIGKLIGAEQIIGGSISKVGNVFSVSSRMISVETGEVLRVANYDFTGDIGTLLTQGIRDVAIQLASGKIPEWSGIKSKKVSSNYKYIASIGAVASGGIGLYIYIQSQNYYKQHQNSTTKSDMESYKDLTKKYLNYSQYCAIAAGGFMLYYVVNKVNEKKLIDKKVNIEFSGDNQSLCNVKFIINF